MAQGAGFNFYTSSVALSEKGISLDDPMTVGFFAEGIGEIDLEGPAAGDTLPNISDYTAVSGGTYAPKALISQATARSTNSGLNQMTATPFTGANKWDSDPSGPTNIKTALLYVTATGDCLGGWDLTTDGGTTAVSLQAGPINLNFGSGSGVVYRAQA